MLEEQGERSRVNAHNIKHVMCAQSTRSVASHDGDENPSLRCHDGKLTSRRKFVDVVNVASNAMCVLASSGRAPHSLLRSEKLT